MTFKIDRTQVFKSLAELRNQQRYHQRTRIYYHAVGWSLIFGSALIGLKLKDFGPALGLSSQAIQKIGWGLLSTEVLGVGIMFNGLRHCQRSTELLCQRRRQSHQKRLGMQARARLRQQKKSANYVLVR